MHTSVLTRLGIHCLCKSLPIAEFVSIHVQTSYVRKMSVEGMADDEIPDLVSVLFHTYICTYV